MTKVKSFLSSPVFPLIVGLLISIIAVVVLACNGVYDLGLEWNCGIWYGFGAGLVGEAVARRFFPIPFVHENKTDSAESASGNPQP